MELRKDSVEIKYEIGDDIGKGHFATVKRCTQRETRAEYAAKFIRKRRGGGRRGAKMEDIEKEIEILSETSHQNIINLYEVYETNREVILILELVDGGELFEHLSEKDKLCEEEASAFIKQILDGVHHLHSRYIAHLDLKPENILLQDKNSTAVKLIDFGLSRKIRPNEDHRAMLGTAEFVAPEVVSFESLSVATDMWSVGVITYIVLSGASPFLGDNQQETYHNVTALNYQFDEEYFNSTSELAKDFIRKLLVKDQRKRATVMDCLNHPWIKPVEKKQQDLRRSSVINTEHLKKFIARQRWKRSMRVVSLCNRLSRSMLLRRIQSSDTLGSSNDEESDSANDNIEEQTDKDIEEQTDKDIKEHTEKNIEEQTDKDNEEQIEKNIKEQTDKDIEEQTEKDIEEKTEKYTNNANATTADTKLAKLDVALYDANGIVEVERLTANWSVEESGQVETVPVINHDIQGTEVEQLNSVERAEKKGTLTHNLSIILEEGTKSVGEENNMLVEDVNIFQGDAIIQENNTEVIVEMTKILEKDNKSPAEETAFIGEKTERIPEETIFAGEDLKIGQYDVDSKTNKTRIEENCYTNNEGSTIFKELYTDDEYKLKDNVTSIERDSVVTKATKEVDEITQDTVAMQNNAEIEMGQLDDKTEENEKDITVVKMEELIQIDGISQWETTVLVDIMHKDNAIGNEPDITNFQAMHLDDWALCKIKTVATNDITDEKELCRVDENVFENKIKPKIIDLKVFETKEEFTNSLEITNNCVIENENGVKINRIQTDVPSDKDMTTFREVEIEKGKIEKLDSEMDLKFKHLNEFEREDGKIEKIETDIDLKYLNYLKTEKTDCCQGRPYRLDSGISEGSFHDATEEGEVRAIAERLITGIIRNALKIDNVGVKSVRDEAEVNEIEGESLNSCDFVFDKSLNNLLVKKPDPLNITLFDEFVDTCTDEDEAMETDQSNTTFKSRSRKGGQRKRVRQNLSRKYPMKNQAILWEMEDVSRNAGGVESFEMQILSETDSSE